MKNKTICKALAGITIVVQTFSLIPILYCSFFDYATGDDLGYSTGVHRIMENGGSLLDILRTITDRIVSTWYSYQGTWSSLFLFQLQPGIWGERTYIITPWIALACILCGTGYFLYQLLVRRAGFSRQLYTVVFNVIIVIMIQMIPKIRGGLFWYTSIAHYIIPYLAATMVMGWSIRFMETAYKRYLIGCILVMCYLGGAGYPLVVLAAVWMFFLILGSWLGVVNHLAMAYTPVSDKKRVVWLLIPLVLEMIGFMFSAAAPGNKVRGGEDFGFSFNRVIRTVLGGFLEEFKAEVQLLIGYHFMVTVVIGLIIIVVWRCWDVSRSRLSLRHPIWTVWVAFLISSVVRMPAIYADVEVSGGVPDVEFFTTVLALFLTVIYLTGFLKKINIGKQKKSGSVNTVDRNRHSISALGIFLLLAIVLFLGTCVRRYWSASSDGICISYIRSGQAYDFQRQMQERLAVLEDPSIKNVVLPEMNPEQGPIMHMALTRDPDSFTNRVTADYYSKDMVIAIPRDEYQKLYGRQEN